MLVLVGVIGLWLVAVAALVILCQATRRLDEEIQREDTGWRRSRLRLPFAS